MKSQSKKIKKNLSYQLKWIIVGAIILVSMLLADFIFPCKFGTRAEFCGFITILGIIPLIIFVVLGILITWIVRRLENKKKRGK